MNIKISIVVPLYNVEKELDRCVQSIMHQTYENIEIILVDDGSPDNCPTLCDEYQKQDERIIVIHKENGGLSDARNYGLNKATGDYVMYVDSDDYLELNACEKLLAGVYNDVDFVVGIIREISGEKVTYQKRTNLKSGEIYPVKEFIIESIKKNEFYAPAVLNLYNRKFLIENELYFKVGYYFEDQQMLVRLYLAAKKIAYIDYPFYNYIIREGSITTSSNSKEKVEVSLIIWEEWFEIISKVKDKELQKYLYGILVRYYLRSSRMRKVKGWQVLGMNFGFAVTHALGIKEKIKVVAYTLAPTLYIRNE